MSAAGAGAREPGRLRAGTFAAGMLYAYRLVGAFVLAYPAARTLGAFGPMASPEADQALFEPGGYHLLEALRLAGHAVPASVESAAVLLSAVGILGLVPLALAQASLAAPGGTPADWGARAAAVLPRLLVLGGGTMLARAGLVIGGLVAVGAASTLGEGARDERVPVALGAAVLAPLLSLWLLLGIVQDLARASVVRLDATVGDGLSRALTTLRERPAAVLGAYALLTLAGGSAVGLAAWAAGALDVSRPGSARVWGAFAAHQSAVLALVVLRVAWLGRALALVSQPREEPPAGLARQWPDGTPGRSDEPADPTPDPGA
jgi:hypothetical protein